jgi:hypothetical protein
MGINDQKAWTINRRSSFQQPSWSRPDGCSIECHEDFRMKTMGKYCKAYPVKSFREYQHWKEKTDEIRQDRGGDAASRQLQDCDCLYLQENLTVTDGISLDENIIFNNITEEWRAFCTIRLKFEIPDVEM